ncbi:efflux RND transporter permease subunit [Gluconobacter wancherniae]|uniref:Transport system membrane protein n=1 Tax=Gluconobacter wancherniae NBRC 103581 TaxID=656744 RepID=A0A511B3K8_9PROT|nr:efflux RND transporter permease subunit [Gluconobacter wancherniae]MBF0853924.1 MMPL family transporter [Gluconobacter wancherniae]MBS1062310.1 efflux RND transporter permease subunit [Gluconobacter wancherniae]GBD56979.1 transport system membrane protein [Gluconobacter wancherniae NBRC 103581]GBR64936.1 multidrug efflux pump acriflavin resistance protein AcrB/AcrD/AcrF [Gluconobacter wancherniae NBRC 103581]GEK94253.1 transport system membrane protein [Gluconobacter wancherniae NBRC 103581
MNPIRFFVLRPVGTTLLAVALLIGGILGYFSLPVADLPNVDFPVIVVTATQPGGSPSEIAATIAEPLERHLGAISGLTEMTSQSTVNQTRITLQFELSRDINGAARDVEAALQAARQDLPTTLRANPTYQKANSNGPPILAVTLTSKTRTPQQLYDFASNVLVQQLSQIQGVGEVDIRGSSLPAVRVEINPLRIFRYGIGFEDIRAALASANAHTPKGFIEAQGTRLTLSTNDQATKAASYRDLIIAYRNNQPVRLSDVAEVNDSVEDLRQAGFLNGQRAIICTVFSQGGANIIKTIDGIRARFPMLKEALPGNTDMSVLIDRSVTIRASLDDTKQTLIIAVALVVGVVLLFLRSLRAIIVPAIVVPVSIIGTFGAMAVLGYQLDNMSLMALTISTGFVVDDAIVVLENITRYMEMGYSREEASIRGASEVAFTVVSITVSLVVVFTPILLMGGIAGRLFHEFAITMVITLAISMLLSLTLTPMISAHLLKHADEESNTFWSRTGRKLEAAIDAVARGYESSLDWSLQHRFLVALSLPATLVLAGFLFVKLPKGFFPSEDTGQIMGRLVTDQSISFHALQDLASRAQKVIASDPDVRGVMGGLGGRAANSANMFVSLKPKSERTDSLETTIRRITQKFSHVPGAQLRLMAPGSVRTGARSSDGAYQYSLQGASAEELYEWTPKIVTALSHLPQLMDVTSDIEEGGQMVDIRLDRDTEARYLVTPQLVSNSLYDAFGQRAASIIYGNLNQYRVVMEAAPRFWSNPETLKQMWVSVSGGTAAGGTASNNIRVRTSTTATTLSQSELSYQNSVANSLAGGKSASSGAAVTTSAETMVPLSVVSLQHKTNAALAVNHQGQFVATTVSFNLAPGAALGPAVSAVQEALLKLHVPRTIQGGFAGNAAAFQKSVGDEPILILAALAAVYIVLGVLYESLIHPLTILSTLPSAGVGALLALQVCGEEFSLIAMIGVILLIGIVKKNAIMLIDFAMVAQRNGATATEAIREASRLRFRPILMTSLAAAFGAVPLIIGNGYGCELRRPLGISILGGLIVSQLLTLYSTPVVFLYLDRFGKALQRLRQQFAIALHLSPRETEI